MEQAKKFMIEIENNIDPKSLEDKIMLANSIIATSLMIVKEQKLLHPDNCDDLIYIVEDFLFSISDPNYHNFNINYTTED